MVGGRNKRKMSRKKMEKIYRRQSIIREGFGVEKRREEGK